MTTKESHNFKSFEDFYPFYLSEHSNQTCRKLHIIGTFLGLLNFFIALLGNPVHIIYGLLCGYGFAWVGHFFFEKNTPATFTYPFWSFLGDFRMFFDCMRGALPL